jgi:PAS domain S-box-containing protein
MDSRTKRPGFPWHLLVVFALLAAGIAAVGSFYYRSYERHHRNEVERQLLAIAELKTDELTGWRRERMENAAVFFRNAAFSALVRRHFDNPDDGETQGQLRAWLGQFQTGLSYGHVFLLDARGVSRMQIPDSPEPLAPHLPQDAAETLRSGKITFLDFHRDTPDGPLYLANLVPIFDEQDDNRPLGVLVLRLDPTTYLYPFLSRWPTPSPTAETLLVRRDGDDALFLNELRFQKNTALTLRVPLTRKAQPAVMAALGREGIVEGVDYRGVPVIAALRAVPDSPWFLVARMDASEVYAPVRERLWIVLVLVGALLLGAGAAMVVAWRQRSAVFYREKIEAAEALRVSEEKYRTLHESMRDAFVRVGLDGRIVEFNKTYQNMLGYSADELRTLTYQELTPAKWHALEARIVDEQIMKLGYSDVYEKEYRRKDGTVFPVELRATLLRDPVGKPVSVWGIARDITERKRAEEAERQKSEELAQANDELTRFASTVSHDLKSPLVTIKTFLGYLEADIRGQDAARVEKDMAYIRAAADKMSRLLDELLELSRIGRKTNPSVEAPLQDIVREALSLVAGQIAQRGVKIQVTEEPVLLYGDRQRLVEIFQNLVDNAVKFMGDQPAPCIRIGAEQTDGETMLFVQDNGIGIDPRHQTKLFGLFEKLDPATEGTGIGLALVRRIVEVHGGRIWVLSAGPGKGATFRFTLAGTRR